MKLIRGTGGKKWLVEVCSCIKMMLAVEDFWFKQQSWFLFPFFKFIILSYADATKISDILINLYYIPIEAVMH